MTSKLLREACYEILKKDFYKCIRSYSSYKGTSCQQHHKRQIMNNWWPVSDEEWDQLNYPKYPKPVDKQ